MMDMGNIESIEVLKDADATAIYGSRGASGVVLITTKKGKAGSTAYDINYSTGGSYLNLPDMLSTNEYVAYRKEAFANDGIALTNANAYDLLLWDTVRNDNNIKYLMGNMAKFSRLQAAVSGGASNVVYRIGAHYNRETTSVFKSPASSNLGTSANIVSNSRDNKFTLNLNTSFSHSLNNQSALDLATIMLLPPNMKLYEEDGSLAWNEGGIYVLGVDNPLAALSRKNEVRIQTYQLSSQLSYAVLPNLTLRANIGYNQNKSKSLRTNPISSQNPMGSVVTGSASWAENEFISYNIEPQLEYIKNAVFNGQLTVLLGGTYNESRNQGSYLAATGYTNDDYVGTYIGLTSNSFTSPQNLSSDYKYAAGFARVLYNLSNRYNLSLSGRRDGSS